MRKTFLTTLFLLFASSLVFGQIMRKSSPQTTPGSTENKVPTVNKMPDLVGLADQKAPDFISANMDGTEYNLATLRGKIVVINLWATFCEPCIKEMPELNALTEKYKGKDVVFLAPAADNKALLEGFLQKNPFKYQVLPGAMNIISRYAPKKKVPSPTDRPGGFMMLLPTHLVIDREGTVTNHFWGYKQTTANDLSQIIDKLLANKSQLPAVSKAQ